MHGEIDGETFGVAKVPEPHSYYVAPVLVRKLAPMYSCLSESQIMLAVDLTDFFFFSLSLSQSLSVSAL